MAGVRNWTGISCRQFSRRKLRVFAQEYAEEIRQIENSPMPTTYGECQQRGLSEADRPCLYLECNHHALSSVSQRTGAIKLAYARRSNDGIPDINLDEIDPARTCSLREIDRTGGATLEDTATMFGLTRERVRQIEKKAFAILRRDLHETTEERPVSLKDLHLFLED